MTVGELRELMDRMPDDVELEVNVHLPSMNTPVAVDDAEWNVTAGVVTLSVDLSDREDI